MIRVLAVAALLSLAGCVAPGPYAGYGGYYDAGADYYEPLGGFYGGWGPGYAIGPFRDHDHFGGGRFFHGGRGRPIPSIAGGFHGGGFNGAGFHGGGMHRGAFHGGRGGGHGHF